MKHQRQRGVAIVEFALVMPILLLMTFFTTEIGRAVWQYNTLTKSVRDAARYLSVEMQGTHIDEAQNLIIYGYTNPPAGAAPLAIGLQPRHVAAPVWGTAGTSPVINIVTVRVTGYQFQSLIGTAFGLDFGNLTFPDITATMRSPLI
jgi:Flp pilus assembly protein TadG